MITTWDFGLYSVVEVETLTLKEALHMTIQMQMDHVIFESDSQMLVQPIHANYVGNS